jgi:hypothetical protein
LILSANDVADRNQEIVTDETHALRDTHRPETGGAVVG